MDTHPLVWPTCAVGYGHCRSRVGHRNSAVPVHSFLLRSGRPNRDAMKELPPFFSPDRGRISCRNRGPCPFLRLRTDAASSFAGNVPRARAHVSDFLAIVASDRPNSNTCDAGDLGTGRPSRAQRSVTREGSEPSGLSVRPTGTLQMAFKRKTLVLSTILCVNVIQKQSKVTTRMRGSSAPQSPR